MARTPKSPKSSKQIDALKHDAASRRNIPTAEMESFFRRDEEALRSDVLVFQQDEGSTPKEPLLRFLRSGSVSSPAKTLYAFVPDDWTVEPTTESAVGEIESIPSLGRKLARLAATTYFRSSETDSVRFKVEPDMEGRERELELASLPDVGFILADERWELVGTPVWPLIREAGKQPRVLVHGRTLRPAPGRKMGPVSHAVGWRRLDGTLLARPL